MPEETFSHGTKQIIYKASGGWSMQFASVEKTSKNLAPLQKGRPGQTLTTKWFGEHLQRINKSGMRIK